LRETQNEQYQSDAYAYENSEHDKALFRRELILGRWFVRWMPSRNSYT